MRKALAATLYDFFLSISPRIFTPNLWRPGVRFWTKAKKKNCYVALTRPKFENWVGWSIFLFFFLTYPERVEFSNIFFQVSKWGKLGRNAVKTHIYKCFFKPLDTNFSKFFAQIWHKKKKKKKKKTRPCFFTFLRSVGRGQYNNLGGGGPNVTFYTWHVGPKMAPKCDFVYKINANWVFS